MNSNVKRKFKNLFNIFFWRQHPEAALRYLPVVSEIKRRKLEDSKILEIGSGSLGIVPYLKKNIEALDIDFSGPQTKLLKKLKGKADNIPFRKNSYDVAISVDVIEHLDPQIREKAIYEMLKVAKKLAVIVVPEGEDAQNQDKKLYARYVKVFKKPHPFLYEHVKYGLPKKEEILVAIDRSARLLNKKAKVESYSNLNLFVRNILMHTWITKNRFVYYLYLKGYLLLIPLLRFCNFGKTYRRVFVIEFSNPVNSDLEPYSNRVKLDE